VTFFDKNTILGKINIFIPFIEQKTVLKKVTAKKPFNGFDQIVYPRDLYRLTEKLYKENSWAENCQSKGHRYDVGSNIFDILSKLFYEKKPVDKNEYAKIFGRENNIRNEKWIRKDYLKTPDNFNYYKIFIPKSNGSGAIGEVLSTPLVGCTTTFLCIGKFKTKQEANDCLKYIKTKFCRFMLGILKVTQDNTKETWKYVPLQDFTANSDIDWSKSVSEIDKQLYKKYGLSAEEISFIESKVREM